MKRIFGIAILIIVGIILIVFLVEKSQSIDTSSVEKIELRYDCGKQKVDTFITNYDDYFKLLKIISSARVIQSSETSCGFGAVELVLEGKDIEIKILPACDKCNLFYIKEKNVCYSMSIENRELLEQLLLKYSVIFPCI